MKTIGLLGGMSWESTAVYYQLLNRSVRERLGGLHSAECVLHSVDFAGIAELQSAGRWDEAGERLVTVARGLQRAGAELLVLCTNTMHKVADALEREVDVPLVHIADATAHEASRRGHDTVGLLATRFTMEQDFYVRRMADRHGIEVLVPDAEERAEIHAIIYDELCQGRVEDASRRRCLAMIDGLARRGAGAVVLGCTELTLLVGDGDTDVPLVDSTRIHVEAALDRALEVRPTLDHCVIHVSDWTRSNAFYRDVVGATLVERPNGRWAYRFGAQQLNVHGPGVEVEEVARLPVQPGNSDLCFEWPGPIEGAVARLREHDVAIESGPVRRHGGRGAGTSVYFRDPDGSLLEFISYA